MPGADKDALCNITDQMPLSFDASLGLAVLGMAVGLPLAREGTVGFVGTICCPYSSEKICLYVYSHMYLRYI